jgi:cytochrome c-type biogenesis protein CcmF
MTGSVFVWIALVSACAAAVLYGASAVKKIDITYARTVFFVSAASVLIVSALFLAHLLLHRFEYAYVVQYTSRSLPTPLLISAFWAGRQGSILLWTLVAAVIGIVLQRFGRKNGMEAEAMAAYSAVLAFLILLLAVKSPFEYIWQANSAFKNGLIPQDGRGLNPLLQNFWMIIHPPVMLIGFASLAVPFVLAVAALWRKDYANWIRGALPWVLLSALTMGAGLILGGYWAYGVLGWGGWWGWDPVENSSLIPWIIAVLLVHTLLIQSFTGKLLRTNFVLSILGYLCVVYSTFLTRSGILANFSVHSYTGPGKAVNVLFILWLLLSAAAGFGLLFRRRGELHSDQPSMKIDSMESILSLALLVLGACAVVIFFGTNAPLFLKSAFEPSFYDQATLPLAVLFMLLLGGSLALRWNRGMESRRDFFINLRLPFLAASAGTVLLIFFGLRDFGAGALIFSSFFTLCTVLKQGKQVLFKNPKSIGGSVSHIGIAILFLGIAGSGRYGVQQTVFLSQNQPQNVLGYTLTYEGSNPDRNGKTASSVRVEKDGLRKNLMPLMYESPYNKSIMGSPDYTRIWMNDVYIEPDSLEAASIDGSRSAVLDAEFSVKPFMGLVWTGALFVLAGFFIALLRRL